MATEVEIKDEKSSLPIIQAEEPEELETQLEGQALKAAIKNQVEFYFSKSNLESDLYLVSQMDSQMYVPTSVIAEFGKVKALTQDLDLIVESVTNSSLCALNTSKTAIKPNIKAERNTIILRDIPSDTKENEVREIFTGEGCGKIANVHSDVGDTWFITMDSEQDAVSTLLHLKTSGKTFKGNHIKARLKSENILRSFFPVPTAGESTQNPTANGFMGAPGSQHASYYGGAGSPFFPGGAGAPDGFGQASATYGQQANRMYRGGNNGPMYDGYYSDARYGRNQGRGRGAGLGGRHGKGEGRKGAGLGQQGAGAVFTPSRGGRGSGRGGRDTEQGRPKQQPVFSTANFPPLAPEKAQELATPGYAGEFHKYSEEDVLLFASHMSEDDWKLPETGLKKLLTEYPEVLTVDAHPDLLRRQRTVSIEQARAAIRHGRPAHGYNDGEAIGQDDYNSMLYGEGAAREQTGTAEESKAETTKSEAVSSGTTEKEKEDNNATVGYAAALLKGPKEPPPKPAVKPKSKPPNSTSKQSKGKDNKEHREHKDKTRRAETDNKDRKQLDKDRQDANRKAAANKRGWEKPGVHKVESNEKAQVVKETGKKGEKDGVDTVDDDTTAIKQPTAWAALGKSKSFIDIVKEAASLPDPAPPKSPTKAAQTGKGDRDRDRDSRRGNRDREDRRERDRRDDRDFRDRDRDDRERDSRRGTRERDDRDRLDRRDDRDFRDGRDRRDDRDDRERENRRVGNRDREDRRDDRDRRDRRDERDFRDEPRSDRFRRDDRRDDRRRDDRRDRERDTDLRDSRMRSPIRDRADKR